MELSKEWVFASKVVPGKKGGLGSWGMEKGMPGQSSWGDQGLKGVWELSDRKLKEVRGRRGDKLSQVGVLGGVSWTMVLRG